VRLVGYLKEVNKHVHGKEKLHILHYRYYMYCKKSLDISGICNIAEHIYSQQGHIVKSYLFS